MAILLSADVGGTKVYLRAIDRATDAVLAEKRYLCKDFDSMQEVIKAFKAEHQLSAMTSACLGLPAPVRGRQVPLTNLDWTVDADLVETECGIAEVFLINDFAAAAYGIDLLQADDVVVLQENLLPEAEQKVGNRLVVGAGTGLGVAPVIRCDGVFIPQDSEGGHIDFAPLNDEQERLLTWLHQKWQHVSYERLLSGEGLETLYKFYRVQSQGSGHRHTHTAEQISQFAKEGDVVAMRTLEAFVEIYGAYVGNLALIWPAASGIYIAGGIAARIQDWMIKDGFLTFFKQKGRMSKIVEKMGVYLVTNEQLGLLGATYYVKQHATK